MEGHFSCTGLSTVRSMFWPSGRPVCSALLRFTPGLFQVSLIILLLLMLALSLPDRRTPQHGPLTSLKVFLLPQDMEATVILGIVFPLVEELIREVSTGVRPHLVWAMSSSCRVRGVRGHPLVRHGFGSARQMRQKDEGVYTLQILAVCLFFFF